MRDWRNPEYQIQPGDLAAGAIFVGCMFMLVLLWWVIQ